MVSPCTRPGVPTWLPFMAAILPLKTSRCCPLPAFPACYIQLNTSFCIISCCISYAMDVSASAECHYYITIGFCKCRLAVLCQPEGILCSKVCSICCIGYTQSCVHYQSCGCVDLYMYPAVHKSRHTVHNSRHTVLSSCLQHTMVVCGVTAGQCGGCEEDAYMCICT